MTPEERVAFSKKNPVFNMTMSSGQGYRFEKKEKFSDIPDPRIEIPTTSADPQNDSLDGNLPEQDSVVASGFDQMIKNQIDQNQADVNLKGTPFFRHSLYF
jgi:hypothetical protein